MDSVEKESPCVVPEIIRNYKQGAKKPTVAEQLLSWHRENSVDNNFGVIVKNAGLMRSIIQYESDRKSARQSAGHPHKRIFDIEPLPGLVTHMRMEPRRVRVGRKWVLQYGMMQGTFRIRVTESLHIFIVTWGMSPKDMSEMAIGPQKAFDILHERLETKRKRLIVSAPPRGVWSMDYIHRQNGAPIVHFVKKKFDAENMLRFKNHPMFGAVAEDMQAFFSNIEWYTRYAQPGMRKVLMTGAPGTGKTSIAMALAAMHHDKFLVVYANTSDDVIQASELAAAKSRPTIIVAEEIDMLKQPTGFVLNWLDGSETPRNTAGTYLITTTNYPRKIDPRILKRPGRIDRAFRVGALRSRDCAKIALSYIGEDGADIDVRELGRALDRTTPAEIKEIVGLSLRAISPGQSLSVEIIASVREGLKRTLMDVASYADDDPETREELHKSLGPMDDDLFEERH